MREPQVAQQPLAPDDDPAAVHHAARPEARQRLEAVDRRPRSGLRRGAPPASALVAAALIAAAIGCSEACSTAPAYRSTSAGSVPGAAASAVTVIWPLVTVPVLSSTTVSISPDDSSA